MLILAQEMFAWRHRKLPWLLIVLSNLVMAKDGKRRLEAYSLVEEADDETHLVPQSPPPCPWVQKPCALKNNQEAANMKQNVAIILLP